ncbi:MAG: enoyl-CoA hydratase/isomerase family protein [Burkholderiales bacterium]|nr:enoyl-CoA hydratase/isomerase family protein [Burkholderiales bacterium]
MSQRPFRIERDGPVTVLSMDWPDRVNAMGLQFSRDFLAALDAIETDGETRVLIITGAARVFCGGGDLFELMSPEPTDIERDLDLVRGYNRVAERLHYFDVPVIAAVNGPAVGGGAGVALACDIAIASEHGRYDIFFGKVGLSGADVGVPYLLSRLIGPMRANYYLYTAGSIDAATGLSIGVFAEVVQAEQLLARAKALGREIAGNFSYRAARMTKVSMRHGANMDFRANLEYEAYVQTVAFQSPAHKQRIGEYRQRVANKRKKS